jgi:hypothetical protein
LLPLLDGVTVAVARLVPPFEAAAEDRFDVGVERWASGRGAIGYLR